MLELLYSTALAVLMLTPNLPAPAEYTIISEDYPGTKLGYHPQKGWIDYAQCHQECKVPANTRKWIFSGEWNVATFGELKIQVQQDGVTKYRFGPFFFGYGAWRENQ